MLILILSQTIFSELFTHFSYSLSLFFALFTLSSLRCSLDNSHEFSFFARGVDNGKWQWNEQHSSTWKEKRRNEKRTWTFLCFSVEFVLILILSFPFTFFYPSWLAPSTTFTHRRSSPSTLFLLFAYEEKWKWKCLRGELNLPEKTNRGKKDKIRWKWENILLNLLYICTSKRERGREQRRRKRIRRRRKFNFFPFSFFSSLFPVSDPLPLYLFCTLTG